MLKGLYRFAVGRSKPVKYLCKTLAAAGVPPLSKVRGFEVGNDLSLMSYQMLLGTWERGTVAVCKRFLQPGMTAIDVGAHVGYYSRLFARLVGPQGKIYAFEPHPESFVVLQRNVRRFSQVIPLQMAVIDENREVVLHESAVGSGGHSLLACRGPHVRQLPVRGIALDWFLYDQHVDFLKIDVEGVEIEVLQGMRELAYSNKNLTAIIEFYPRIIMTRGIPPQTLLETLSDMEFELYAIKDPDGELISLSSWGDHDNFIKSIPKYVNLLAKKGARESV
jgi:FkbM family methyltransferase